MAKYSTKRKFKYRASQDEIAVVEQNVNSTVEYVKNWKRKELVNFAFTKTNKIPVVIPIDKDAYIIGRFGLKKENGTWKLSDIIEDQHFNFSKRSSAVLYAVCSQMGQHKIANEIQLYDSDVLRIAHQLEIFNYKLQRAIQKKDSWRTDYFRILSSRANFRLQDAKNQLEKTTNLAKYFKIWE